MACHRGQAVQLGQRIRRSSWRIRRTIASASHIHGVHGGQVVQPEQRRPRLLVPARDEQVGLVHFLQAPRAINNQAAAAVVRLSPLDSKWCLHNVQSGAWANFCLCGGCALSCWSVTSSDTDTHRAHSQLPCSYSAGRNKRTTRLCKQQQRTFRSAVASSFRVKFATAGVLSGKSLRSAYSRTFAMINSEKCTRSPGSPAVPRLGQKWAS